MALKQLLWKGRTSEAAGIAGAICFVMSCFYAYMAMRRPESFPSITQFFFLDVLLPFLLIWLSLFWLVCQFKWNRVAFYALFVLVYFLLGVPEIGKINSSSSIQFVNGKKITTPNRDPGLGLRFIIQQTLIWGVGVCLFMELGVRIVDQHVDYRATHTKRRNRSPL